MSQLLIDQPLNDLLPYDDWGIVETVARNRGGKTMLNAWQAWKAYCRGLDVYCNCGVDPETGRIQHILNFPHYDYTPGELFGLPLFRCFVLTDEAIQFMDSSARTKAVRNMIYFNYQAKKRLIAWRYDAVLHKNIDRRVRLNPDYIVYCKRYPQDWKKPLQALKVTITHEEFERVRWIIDPIGKGLGKLYNDVAPVQPEDIDPDSIQTEYVKGGRF